MQTISQELMGKSDPSLDVLSHDSTHVRLVMEAEKQSSIARYNASEILSKYSKDKSVDEPDKNEEGRDDDVDDKQEEPLEPQISEYMEYRNEYIDNNKEKQDVTANNNNDETSSKKESVFDEQFEEITDEDLEHIAKCIMPLSPKGLKKGKKKKMSGRFEFMRINNGALTVVKSHRKMNIKSTGDISEEKKEEKELESEKSAEPEKRGRLFSMKSRRSSRRSRSRSRASRDFDSGIHTDDACLQNLDEQSVKEKSKLKMKAKPTQSAYNKEVKQGDLPPKPSMPKPKVSPKSDDDKSVISTSSKATASDYDFEEVISVETGMSSLSEMSVSEKMKKRGPIVLTESMIDNAVIPDMICLKMNVKLTKIQVLKRKMSFSKGKI